MVTIAAGVAGGQFGIGRTGATGDAGVLILPDLGVAGPGVAVVNFAAGRTFNLRQFFVVPIGEFGGADEGVGLATGSGTVQLFGFEDQFNLANEEFVGAVLTVDHSLTVASAGGCLIEPFADACLGGFGSTAFVPGAGAASLGAVTPVGIPITATVTYSKGHPVKIVTNPSL